MTAVEAMRIGIRNVPDDGEPPPLDSPQSRSGDPIGTQFPRYDGSQFDGCDTSGWITAAAGVGGGGGTGVGTGVGPGPHIPIPASCASSCASSGDPLELRPGREAADGLRALPRQDYETNDADDDQRCDGLDDVQQGAEQDEIQNDALHARVGPPTL